jgi:hypothetical protein
MEGEKKEKKRRSKKREGLGVNGEPETFFGFEMKPYTTFFGFSLMNSILFVSFIDMLFGVLNLIRFVNQNLLLYLGRIDFYDILLTISFFIGALSIIFAFNAIKSILILKYEYLSQYSMYKQVEFVVQTLIALLIEVDFFTEGVISYPVFALLLVTRLFLYIIAKAVWSASLHIKRGDTYLVIEGTL